MDFENLIKTIAKKIDFDFFFLIFEKCIHCLIAVEKV